VPKSFFYPNNNFYLLIQQ